MSRDPDQTGVIRYSQWIPGASDSGPDDEPRSYWEKLLREEAAEKARKDGWAKASPQHRRAVITSKTVLGVPRAEFGPTAANVAKSIRASVAERDRPKPNAPFRVIDMSPAISMMQDRATYLPSGVTLEKGYPTYRPDNLQKQVMKDHLAARGMPAKQVDDLKFVEGLDQDAGFFTRQTSKWIDPEAVTQGNTVYVRPDKFDDVVEFNSNVPFEEAYHAADFSSSGGAGFYPSYTAGLVGGLLSKWDAYYGNMHEAFAKGAAREMRESYLRRRYGDKK